MGRKRKERTGIYDRIGEEISPEKCPECKEHTDCFSCMEGRCTALKASGGQGCFFYKPAEKGIEECRSIYQKLRKSRRYDLIKKYFKSYVALGILDDDIDAETEYSRRLEDYRESDFKALMSQVPGFD